MTTTTEQSTKLRLSFEGTARIEVHVDLIAWYAELGERARREYMKWKPAEDSGWHNDMEPWRKPVAYLDSAINEDFELSSGIGSRAVSEMSEIDDWNAPSVWERPYTEVGKRDTKWTEQDHHALLAAVPWMRVADVDDATRAELERTEPGPFDRPLFGDEAPGGRSDG